MTTFPFTAVVGQDDAKLALVLNAIDPRVGGVLLRGHKGSAKSTLARGLAALTPGSPFVELPVGATEDRVVGTLDVAGVLRDGEVRFTPGLLADADRGVLYIDEVNLLADHLVDVLLDVAASGVNRVEREGFSRSHPSRFVLVGSMNREEGDLRPQLLDRFGLAVDVEAPDDVALRAEVVRTRLAFDADPDAFTRAAANDEAELSRRIAAARPADVPDDIVSAASRVCVAAAVEGLRADLVIVRAAAALAGLEGRAAATIDDVRRVAPLALVHRRRRSPFETGGVDQQLIDEALESEGSAEPSNGDGSSRDDVVAPDAPSRIVTLGGDRLRVPSPPGRRSTVESARGRHVGDRAPREGAPPGPIAGRATVVAAATRSASAGAALSVEPDDIRESVRLERAANLIVLAVDASGSMGVERRMEAVKGAVLSLLLDAYQRRDRVALVTFRGDAAEVVLRPTGSVEVAKARIAELPTGGQTPLGAGIEESLAVASRAGSDTHQPLIVLITDGRATSGPEGAAPFDAALRAGHAVAAAGVRSIVIDAEAPSRAGAVALGLAPKVAAAMGAQYLALEQLSADALAGSIRSHLR